MGHKNYNLLGRWHQAMRPLEKHLSLLLSSFCEIGNIVIDNRSPQMCGFFIANNCFEL